MLTNFVNILIPNTYKQNGATFFLNFSTIIITTKEGPFI